MTARSGAAQCMQLEDSTIILGSRDSLFSPPLQYQLLHKVFLRLLRFQGRDLCGVREGTASKARHPLFDRPSAGIIQIAERNAIVEGHKEGVRIPAKGYMPLAMCVRYRCDNEAPMTLTASRVYKCYRTGNSDQKFYQIKWVTRTRRNEVGYIRAQIPVPLLSSTRQAQLKEVHGALTGNRAIISNAAILTPAERA